MVSRILVRHFSFANIRCALYIPAHQDRFYKKAIQCKPELFVPDLEDSVPLNEKEIARKMCREEIEFLHRAAPNVKICPRANEINSMFHKDVDSVLTATNAKMIYGFGVAKISTVEEMAEVDAYLTKKEVEFKRPKYSFKVIPGIETTKGIVNAYNILTKFRPRIEAATFGGDDYCTDFAIKRTEQEKELELPKKLFALHCHAAEVICMDTPYIHIKNLEGLKKELEIIKQYGFKGKFAIHPTQIEIIEKAFLPAKKEVEYSARLVEAFKKAVKDGKAAIVFENKMVDIAAYKRAINMLNSAGIQKAFY